MKKILFSILFLTSSTVRGVQLAYLAQASISHKMKFKKSVIGGLSGIYRDMDSEKYFAVSDDRGSHDEPRIYELRIVADLKSIRVEPKNVIYLSVNESSFSHQKTNSKSKLFSRVLDLEGLSVAPWGDFLLINEGDMNKKPRVFPQFFGTKRDGEIQKEFPVPESFLPGPTGPQAKGVRNNRSFEGLSVRPDGKEWIVAAEGPLMQDSGNFIRLIQYRMSEAWLLKPFNELRYPLGPAEDRTSPALEIQKGVSEVLFLDQNRLLVLERSVVVSPQGIKFKVRIFETDLRAKDKDQTLKKKLVLDLSHLEGKTGPIENFEGMTLGPQLSEGRKSLILVSDDNFMRDQRTLFLLFAIKE